MTRFVFIGNVISSTGWRYEINIQINFLLAKATLNERSSKGLTQLTETRALN